MTLAPPPPPDVGRWFHALPEEARPVLLGLRALVHDLAGQHDLGPVFEALKWGEPSFAVRSGTPVRLGWTEDRPAVCRVLVHCQTSVVSAFATSTARPSPSRAPVPRSSICTR